MRDLFNLDGKVAVVFGGNGYLGREFCEVLLEFGAITYCADFNVTLGPQLKALKRKYPSRFKVVKIDASSKKQLVALKNKIVAKEKKVDILINSVTLKGHDFYLPFEDVSLEGWNTTMLGNLTIPFLTIQTFIPCMVKRKKGSIINIGSHYGLVGNDQRIYEGANLDNVYMKGKEKAKRIYSHGAYNASKGGLFALTRYLAAYYGKDNIRINCISPGGIHHDSENEEFRKKYSERTPLKRKARIDEVNGALVFLASDASSYVTGHNLVVDGGYTIW
jgi:NAD(P)-dependent dehydrogenase (short-subunit alcohol dehydrogenase family)